MLLSNRNVPVRHVFAIPGYDGYWNFFLQCLQKRGNQCYCNACTSFSRGRCYTILWSCSSSFLSTLSQYYFCCCQIIWLLLLIRSTRTYYDLWGEVHRIFSSLCKITAKGYGLPYNSDSGMSQNYVDYEAWLWNRLLYATVLQNIITSTWS